MILRHRSDRLPGLPAPVTLILAGAALTARPPAAAAQAIGTMQVTARVEPAPSAWATLAVATDLAARADAAPVPPPVNVGLARLAVEHDAPDPRVLRIRIDYLCN